MTNTNNLCTKVTNNIYRNSPALMSDGRAFTDYRPNCTINAELRNHSRTFNSHDYRMFLARNGKNLIEVNRDIVFARNRIDDCFCFDQDGTMLPEKKKVDCDRHGCMVTVNNLSGLGYGRQNNTFPELSFPVNLGDNSVVNCCATPLNCFRNQPAEKAQDDGDVSKGDGEN